MNRDDIIRMAREAGIFTGGHPMNPLSVYPSELVRFAAIVAAAEREECAKVCDEEGLLWGQRYAAAIRARGEQK